MAISKSICGNLNKRLKKRGIRSSLRDDGDVPPKFEGPPVGRGSEMCGFMVVVRKAQDLGSANVEVS